MKITIITTKTCPPCRMLKNYIKDWDMTNIELIDAYELTKEQFNKYNVKGVPSVFLEDNGKIVNRFTGFPNEKLEIFKEKIK